jgi:bisphosphoglycerate-independent phosphoglycerate mutase (AlkP superfamily)
MTKKQIKERFIKMAKKKEWDELAYDIITMERALRTKQDAKTLNLLNFKLQIWEKEKASRIFQEFNMKTFLIKSLDDSIVEY